MTREDKIRSLKVITEETDLEVLSTYLDIAESEIVARAFPYDHDQHEVPPMYDTLQVEMAVYMLNKRGAEGQLAHTENSINRQYEAAFIPNSLLRRITPYCGVIK